LIISAQYHSKNTCILVLDYRQEAVCKFSVLVR